MNAARGSGREGAYYALTECSLFPRLAGEAGTAVRNVAALALVTWDLATEEGPYTIEQRDLLYGPWGKIVKDAQKLNPEPGGYHMKLR